MGVGGCMGVNVSTKLYQLYLLDFTGQPIFFHLGCLSVICDRSLTVKLFVKKIIVINGVSTD